MGPGTAGQPEIDGISGTLRPRDPLETRAGLAAAAHPRAGQPHVETTATRRWREAGASWRQCARARREAGTCRARTSRRRPRPSLAPPRDTVRRPDASRARGTERQPRRGLERRLVFRKPCVAIDAVERCLRTGHQVRRERPEVGSQPIDEADHRRAKEQLVLILARPEPLAIVVPLQRPKERQRLRAEAAEAGRCHRATCCVGAWRAAIRSWNWRVRCGTCPIIRCIVIN